MDDHLEILELVYWGHTFVLEALFERGSEDLPDKFKKKLRQCSIRQHTYLAKSSNDEAPEKGNE